jgi:hypothetical protein
MSNLAALLRAGRGAPDADPEEVEQEVKRLFERAAAQGDAIAQAELAEHYASGDAQDSEKSLENLLASARGGYAPAQYAVAALYLEGKGVEKDPGEALRWFREAAQAGMPAAEIALGTLLASGAEGIAQDDATARVWFEKAAARGEADAEWSLGVMHEEGRGGLAPSATRAVEWWMRAAKQGHPLARAKLGVAYVSGEGVRRDLVEAYAWLAASGVPEAQNWVDQLADRLGARDLARAEKLAGERRVQPAADAVSDRTAD